MIAAPNPLYQACTSPMTAANLKPKAPDPSLAPPDLQNPAVAQQQRLDRWAIGLSALCLVHCLAIPVTLLALPLFAHELISHQSFVHWLLLVLALPLSAFALLRGYRRHRYLPVVVAGVIGISTMFVGVAHLGGLELELPLSIAGALCLVYAHVQNMRHSHS
jgi:hypothetical protein